MKTHCKVFYDNDAKFCGSCGEPFPTEAPKVSSCEGCGKMMMRIWEYCIYCGRKRDA